MRGRIPYYGASGIVDYVNTFLFDEDLILLGEDGENILSRVVPLAFRISGKTWVNNHAHVLRPRPEFDIDFLTAYLESLAYSGLNTGTAQPKLNKQSCSTIRVVKPSLPEQRRIASVLRDADDLIASLERVIAKKEAMKQGMMQQLLTGRTRLAGFDRPWDNRRIAEIASIAKGTQLGRASMTSGGTIAVWNGGIEPSGLTSVPNMERAVVTVSEGGNSCGWVGRPQGAFWLGGHCYALDPTSGGHSVPFLYHRLKLAEPQIMSLRVGSGLPNIQKKRLSDFVVSVPTDAEEAEAVADVLDAADDELATLRSRLAKARAIKNGMMQELLTGRTRLPAREAA